jgi:hypothetical protein
MTQPDCSSSRIKNRLKEELIELSELLRHHIEQLPDENVCLMKQFESMRTKMTHLVNGSLLLFKLLSFSLYLQMTSTGFSLEQRM